MTSLSKRLLLTGALTGAFGLVANGEYAREHCQTQKFADGSRTALVETTDFLAGKACSLKLYEDGQAQYEERQVRFFRDNAEDVRAAQKDAVTWISAPSPPSLGSAPPIPF